MLRRPTIREIREKIIFDAISAGILRGMVRAAPVVPKPLTGPTGARPGY